MVRSLALTLSFSVQPMEGAGPGTEGARFRSRQMGEQGLSVSLADCRQTTKPLLPEKIS